MYCSRRCLGFTPKGCHGIRSHVWLVLHGEFVEFLGQSRRGEPLLSGRVEHYFWGEDSNGNPFAFSTEPLNIILPGRSHVHVNGGNNA